MCSVTTAPARLRRSRGQPRMIRLGSLVAVCRRDLPPSEGDSRGARWSGAESRAMDIGAVRAESPVGGGPDQAPVVTMSDEFDALLGQARAGDGAAAGRLLERYSTYLTLLARAQIGRSLRSKVDPGD